MNSTDVIVIGSGFGGAIAAHRLALAGHRVVVLERGPWRDSVPVRSMGVSERSPFPYGTRAITHLVRNLRVGSISLTLNRTGMFEINVASGLSVVSTSNVGGGSHAWDAVLLPPHDKHYWKSRHPKLAEGDVEQHHETVLADLGAVRLSRDQWLGDSVWNQLPEKTGRRCAPTEPQPHVAMLLPRTPDEMGIAAPTRNGVQRMVCAMDGDSFLGSKGGAKASVDFTYLHPAMAHGAVVRDLCEVSRIERSESGGYLIRFRDLRNKLSDVISAPKVVLAAGDLNTLRLLFASSRGPQALHAMPSLGQRFGANGDLAGLWFKKSTRPSMFNSAPFLGQFDVDGATTPCLVLASLPGVDSLPLPGFLKRKLANTVLVLGMAEDSGKGSVGFRRGRLRISYDHRAEPSFELSRQAVKALGQDSGCETWSISPPLTVHPWGGAGIGPDCDHGVVDDVGEVYNNPGLFVADGAALPAAPGAPPTLTIAAWAHHVAERLSKAAA